MAKNQKFDEAGDSQELQALFDSIAGAPSKRRLEVVSERAIADPSGDCDDLQQLFDSVAGEYEQAVPASRSETSHQDDLAVDKPATVEVKAQLSSELFNRIGQLTRQFHEAISELGYDRLLEETARAIPDARQRLSYVAKMTEQAASRVLNATDAAKPIQEELQGSAQALSVRWDKLYAGDLSSDQFKLLADDTRSFIRDVPAKAEATNAQLMEIMMAQDFQDLTGQVIKRLVDTAQSVEQQLLGLLVEFVPDEKRPESAVSLMNGPVVAGATRGDVVTSQQQVDDLLESMGF